MIMYRSERPDKGTIVYVGGLDPNVQKEELETEFQKFGKLTRVWVAFNPPGFAFVEFIEKSDAESAVTALHDSILFGNKLRVEISRGRGRAGRGGGRGSFRGRGGGQDFSPRGGYGGGRGDFHGSRGGDFGRGRGMRGGRGSFGGSFPYERDEPIKPFRGGGIGGRFDDYEARSRSDFGLHKIFLDGGFNDDLGSRDFRGVDGPRGFGPSRDIGERDFPARERPLGGRDYASRDIPERDYGASRGPREYGGYEAERPINGARPYGGVSEANPLDRGYGGRDMGGSRDMAPARDIGGGRDFSHGGMGGRSFGAGMDIGIRRDEIRDFNPPRDLAAARDFAGRPSRVDYADDRFGAGARGGYDDGMATGGYNGGRYAANDVGGSGDFGGFAGARDRFRSRSPIGRASRPMY